MTLHEASHAALPLLLPPSLSTLLLFFLPRLILISFVYQVLRWILHPDSKELFCLSPWSPFRNSSVLLNYLPTFFPFVPPSLLSSLFSPLPRVLLLSVTQKSRLSPGLREPDNITMKSSLHALWNSKALPDF